MTNLILPGNLRYQPQQLVPFWGYDNLYRGVAQVEIAVLKSLGEIGVIPKEVLAHLTSEVEESLLSITTTEVDEIERAITKHDIRAWIRLAQNRVHPDLAKWIHVTLTSYDALDTGRILHYVGSYRIAVAPAIHEVTICLKQLIVRHADTLQIGRTHGQHALPITVGFWLATILGRILYIKERLDMAANDLVGKISGAVGAYNAQYGLQIIDKNLKQTFEQKVLAKLGLRPPTISTQILPPEPLAYYLYSCNVMSAALAQLATDCRHLMRSEIAEIVEAFAKGQVGSSTMAQKRNPLNFENVCSMWLKTKNEFGKVQDAMISEHQRDLTNSALARDFPLIVCNLMSQLNTLLRKDKDGTPFLGRITVNEEACQRNFEQSARFVIAEPLYCALQMAGFERDAHKLVSHTLVPLAQKNNISLMEALRRVAEGDEHLFNCVERIPSAVLTMLEHPEQYTGLASEKALEIAALVAEE